MRRAPRTDASGVRALMVSVSAPSIADPVTVTEAFLSSSAMWERTR